MKKLTTNKAAYITACTIYNGLRYAFLNNTSVIVEKEVQTSADSFAPMYRVFVRESHGLFLTHCTIEKCITTVSKYANNYPENVHWSVRVELAKDEEGHLIKECDGSGYKKEPVFVVAAISEQSKKAFNDSFNIKL